MGAVIGAVIAALIIVWIAFAEVSDNSTGYFRAARDSWLTECQIKGSFLGRVRVRMGRQHARQIYERVRRVRLNEANRSHSGTKLRARRAQHDLRQMPKREPNGRLSRRIQAKKPARAKRSAP